TFGEYGPRNLAQIYLFWAVSTLIFLLTVTVGFLLFRNFVKVYLQRQSNREGSHIQSKLVVGALALSLMPLVFLVLWSYAIPNCTLVTGFSLPSEGIKARLDDAAVSVGDEVQGRASALANWLATLPNIQNRSADFAKICYEQRIAELRIDEQNGIIHV